VHPLNGMFRVGAVAQQTGFDGRVVLVVVGATEVVVDVVDAPEDVRVAIALTQASTADSILGPSPVTAHPPAASALAIASLNLVSAAVRHVGSTAPTSSAFSWHLSLAAIFFAAALFSAIEHFLVGSLARVSPRRYGGQERTQEQPCYPRTP